MALASKQRTADEAAAMIRDGAVVAVNSSSGLCCPDAVLAAIGRRFDATGAPSGLTTIHPIAAGDMFGTKGIDHIAKPGCIARVIAGSYPSGPTNAEPPLIWQRIVANDLAAYNVPSGIVFDMLREAAAYRPGVLTKVGMDTFVDPEQEGCAMNAAARAHPIVRRERFDGEDWLYFPAIAPDAGRAEPGRDRHRAGEAGGAERLDPAARRARAGHPRRRGGRGARRAPDHGHAL